MNKEILISYFSKITHKRYKQLIEHFGSIENAFSAKFSDFGKKLWEQNIIEEFFLWKKQIDEKKIEKELEKENIKTITLNSIDYPPLLREIYDPPICLFIRGDISSIKYPLAVVGTRKPTSYGKQCTENLVTGVCRDMTIVSGLALGIDGIAHETTLNNKGKTIAILGSGIDRSTVSPKAHIDLSEKIIENGGAIMSEYIPKTPGNTFTYPRRNRIIAGMSLGVLVTEAQSSSGALITAQCALDNNREVFAVPHSINSSFGQGPNNLLKAGARVVTESTDILNIFSLQKENTPIKPPPTGDSREETKILSILSQMPLHIDILTRETQIPIYALSSTLTLLEIKGKVRNLGNMNYTLL